MEKGNIWLNNPEYMQFVEFLVEKTKEVKTVLNISELAREFKKQIDFSLSAQCFKNRIRHFRLKIHEFQHFDTETKVKLLFGLSAPVHRRFLRELKEEAEITVDDSDRIIHYKKHDGQLELKGKHSTLFTPIEVSNTRILEFLAKKVEKTSGIIELSTLAKQLKSETGSSQNEHHFQIRFREATKQIYESELFDEEMKVRMMFATCTEVEEYALEELRKHATVLVDKRNRIEEYNKKDGSLYLNKKESQIKRGSRNNTVDEPEDSDEEDVEEEEEGAMDVTTRSGRLSKKRFSGASLLNNKDDMGSSSPRNEKSKNSNTPITSNKKRKISEYMNGSVGKKKKEIQERGPEVEYDNDYSIDVSNQNNNENRVKLEPFKGQLNDDTTRLHIINNGDDFVEEIPAPTEHFLAPKYEEMLMDIKEEEPEIIILDDPIDKEIKEEAAEDVMEVFDDSEPLNSSNNPFKNKSIQQDSTASSEYVQKDHTRLTTILEAFHGFIDILDLPILSNLQKKIEAKLEECKGNSKKVSNEEIYHYLELCLLKVNKNWESKESMDPFSLESFISHFKHAVVHMKCPSLIEFQQKLKRIIGELRVQNKFVPVTTIQNALQIVIDNIINS